MEVIKHSFYPVMENLGKRDNNLKNHLHPMIKHSNKSPFEVDQMKRYNHYPVIVNKHVFPTLDAIKNVSIFVLAIERNVFFLPFHTSIVCKS